MKRAFKEFITTLGFSGLIIAAALAPAIAQKKYDAGVSDAEIKIGNIMPYSGPASAYGVIGMDRGGLFPQDQRRRRHQRPQNQLHFL